MSRRVARRGWRDTGEPAWRRWYARRMRAGLEHCRGCGAQMRHVTVQSRGLRFGHIRAACLGGGDGPANITIVCGRCDEHMGPDDWTGVLQGLCTEPQWRRHQQAVLRRLLGHDLAGAVVPPPRQHDAAPEHRPRDDIRVGRDPHDAGEECITRAATLAFPTAA